MVAEAEGAAAAAERDNCCLPLQILVLESFSSEVLGLVE